jgi:Coenzyme PQQ synthesis protein D (PqqD)
MNEIYIRRAPTVAYRRMGQEVIAMSATDSTLFSLNEVASVIWEAADGRTALSEIVRSKICEEFDVDFAQASQDAQELVQGLTARGLLCTSEKPVANIDCVPVGQS